eukprot:10166721-Alexandrium_andersonii.AAC.1
MASGVVLAGWPSICWRLPSCACICSCGHCRMVPRQRCSKRPLSQVHRRHACVLSGPFVGAALGKMCRKPNTEIKPLQLALALAHTRGKVEHIRKRRLPCGGFRTLSYRSYD